MSGSHAAIVLVILACLPLLAMAKPELPVGVVDGGESAKITQVIDGDTVVLEDGRTVRLVGLQAPKLALGREGFRAWPLSSEAKEVLEGLVLGQKVRLYFAGDPMDRWRRTLAHLVRDDGLWVQGEMLRLGMARVYSFSDNRLGVGAMLEIEEAARDAEVGIWRRSFYGIRSPSETLHLRDSFQIVEGMVLDAALVKGQVFLNFDLDWRTDFTIRIPRNVLREFKSQGVDVLGLEGKMVRVRGWLKRWNGPMIELTHMEQLEPLSH